MINIPFVQIYLFSILVLENIHCQSMEFYQQISRDDREIFHSTKIGE